MEFYLQALQTILQPSYLIVMFFAAMVGIVFGAIPGLSGGLGVSLLLPLTFGMDPTMGFTMLIGVWIGGISGGFISATLIGIPGAPPSIATCYDAYPMSQKGETVRALGIGIVASFIGTSTSIIVATFLSPVIAGLALKLGPWEYFSLCVAAISVVSSLAKGSIFKGFMGAFIGLFLSTVGLSPMDGTYRFTFGNMYLAVGLDMVALMLGIYAIKQIAQDYANQTQTMPDVEMGKIAGFGIKLVDITHNIGVMIRSFFIGLWVGFLPGMGGGLSNMVAYAQAKSYSKNPEEYGKGHPGGIWASELSNNASVGGAIIPMIALGIPGDAVTALLLSGLMIHGLQPGPLLIKSNPQLVYLIFAGVMVAAILVLIQQFFGIRWFPYLLKIPYHYLYGVILIMCYIGGYTRSNSTFNILALLCFAVLGILLDKAGISLAPLILAFILGPKIEEYFRKGISYSDDGWIVFFQRPVSLIFILIAVGSILWPHIKHRIIKAKTV